MRPSEQIVELCLNLRATAETVIKEGYSEFTPEGQWAKATLSAIDEYERATSAFVDAARQPMPKRIGRKPNGER